MADEERQDGQQEPEAQADEQQPTPPEEDAPQQGADPAGEASPADSEEPAAEETPADEPAAEETPADEPAADDAPAADAAAEGEDAPADAEAEEAPAADSEADAPAAAEGEDAPAAAEGDAARERPRKRDRGQAKDSEDEVIPGAHLEPDLVLEEEQRSEDEYADSYADDEAPAAAADADEAEQPVAHTPLDLAADARYRATGKRKTAVARVILRPGEGVYTINGRHLDQFFPRVKLQRMAQQPLETAGYNNRMDVVAKIHGGGVSSQAGALRHGIARALVEADPSLRVELKRRGYLTRDPRVKERKKAGLKKARKRPQFSKR